LIYLLSHNTRADDSAMYIYLNQVTPTSLVLTVVRIGAPALMSALNLFMSGFESNPLLHIWSSASGSAGKERTDDDA